MVKVVKKGELSSTQLATIILVVMGFIIAALFLWSFFGENDLNERELCRLSVLSRATVPGVAEQAVPLNCFTEKVCITVDKSFVEEVKDKFNIDAAAVGISNKVSDCKQFAGEENVRNVEVNLNNPIKAAEIIQRETANAMYDCWFMMGQGKMDIFSGASNGIIDATAEWAKISVQQVKPSCIVCSRVAFSDALTKNDEWNETAKSIDYNRFLSNSKVPNSALTYMQAFTDEGIGSGYGAIGQTENKLADYINKEGNIDNDDLENIKKILIEQSPLDKDTIQKMTVSEIQDYINQLKTKKSDQLAIVFAQIKVSNVKDGDQFWNTLQNGAILSATAGISGPGKVLGLLGFTPLTKVVSYIIGVGGVSTYLAYQAEDQNYQNQALSAATCGKFESTNKDPQKGCSLVKLMSWDINSVNGLCGSIEGNL